MKTEIKASQCYLHIRRGRHVVRIPRSELRTVLDAIHRLEWGTRPRSLQELHEECAVYVDAAARVADISSYAVWHARSRRQVRARRLAWLFILDEGVADYQHDVAAIFGVQVYAVNRGIAKIREDITEHEYTAMMHELEQYTDAAQ